MNWKSRIISLIVIFFVVGIPTFITVFISLNMTDKPWYIYVSYTALAICGVLTVTAGIISVYEYISKLVGKDYPIANQLVAKEILHQVSLYKDDGYKKDLLRNWALRKYEITMDNNQIINLLDTLLFYGLITDIGESTVKITTNGRKYMNRL
ncbi:MAG TPA: hypothetical protein DIW44_12350 [Anaerolineaceae bacterium]|nr:hypothetical protein [Anaerolineaceae bacterium]